MARTVCCLSFGPMTSQHYCLPICSLSSIFNMADNNTVEKVTAVHTSHIGPQSTHHILDHGSHITHWTTVHTSHPGPWSTHHTLDHVPYITSWTTVDTPYSEKCGLVGCHICKYHSGEERKYNYAFRQTSHITHLTLDFGPGCSVLTAVQGVICGPWRLPTYSLKCEISKQSQCPVSKICCNGDLHLGPWSKHQPLDCGPYITP